LTLRPLSARTHGDRNPMRFAAIADIHGNAQALEAVLADIAALGLDQIVTSPATRTGGSPSWIAAAAPRAWITSSLSAGISTGLPVCLRH
jgi:hypothetical protein